MVKISRSHFMKKGMKRKPNEDIRECWCAISYPDERLVHVLGHD